MFIQRLLVKVGLGLPICLFLVRFCFCLFVVMFNFTRSLRRRKVGLESPCKVLELCFVKPV